jgi:serine/threonine protein kinase, bacterial
VHPPSPARAPGPVRGKRTPWILAGALVVVIVVGGFGAWLVVRHTHQTGQVVLPFPGVREPYGMAVDSAGNVYVTDCWNNRVLKLPAGSATQIELPFTALN